MRFLYHLRLVEKDSAWPYAPASFAAEGFIHASYRDSVRSSAALYFPKDAALEVLLIDPRMLDVAIDVATTPRGPMPHVLGAIALPAVAKIIPFESFDAETLPDRVDEE